MPESLHFIRVWGSVTIFNRVMDGIDFASNYVMFRTIPLGFHDPLALPTFKP